MVINFSESRQQKRYKQRQQKKELERNEKASKQVAIQIKNLLSSTLSQETLEEIAKKTHFIVRRRELSEHAIVAALIMGCSDPVNISSLETICCFLNKWFNISIKPQSLQEKLNRKETAMFIKEIAIKIMMHKANKIIEKILQKKTKQNSLFRRILIQDSTVISLPETISRIFRGCGGNASKAALKCDMIIDQANHLIVRIKCTAGKIPDSSMSDDIFGFLQEGDLILRDLGYFNLDNFSKMIQKNIKFISRMKKSVHVYLTKDAEKPLDLIKYLEDQNINKQGVDIEVYIGKEARVPVRLVGIKVPQEVAEMRRSRYKKIRKKDASEELLIWNGYTLMLTNISKEELNLKQILKMYKIRWQIELFFKNIKSNLIIDKFTGKNKFRILTLIYTKLILTWLVSLLYAYAQMIAPKDKQISKYKFTKWLQKEIGQLNVFITNDVINLIKSLNKALRFLYKRSISRCWIDDTLGDEINNKVA